MYLLLKLINKLIVFSWGWWLLFWKCKDIWMLLVTSAPTILLWNAWGLWVYSAPTQALVSTLGRSLNQDLLNPIVRFAFGPNTCQHLRPFVCEKKDWTEGCKVCSACLYQYIFFFPSWGQKSSCCMKTSSFVLYSHSAHFSAAKWNKKETQRKKITDRSGISKKKEIMDDVTAK